MKFRLPKCPSDLSKPHMYTLRDNSNISYAFWNPYTWVPPWLQKFTYRHRRIGLDGGPRQWEEPEIVLCRNSEEFIAIVSFWNSCDTGSYEYEAVL